MGDTGFEPGDVTRSSTAVAVRDAHGRFLPDIAGALVHNGSQIIPDVIQGIKFIDGIREDKVAA